MHDNSAEGFDSMYHCDVGSREIDDDVAAPASSAIVDAGGQGLQSSVGLLPAPPPLPPSEFPLDAASLGSAHSSQFGAFEKRSSTDDVGSMASSMIAPRRSPDENLVIPPHSQV